MRTVTAAANRARTNQPHLPFERNAVTPDPFLQELQGGNIKEGIYTFQSAGNFLLLVFLNFLSVHSISKQPHVPKTTVTRRPHQTSLEAADAPAQFLGFFNWSFEDKEKQDITTSLSCIVSELGFKKQTNNCHAPAFPSSDLFVLSPSMKEAVVKQFVSETTPRKHLFKFLLG